MWESLIPIGASIVSGLFGKDAAETAADAQVRAGEEANALQRYMFEQNRADLAPWRDTGKASLAQLAALMAPDGDLTRRFTMADFEADPGYQFRLAEGLKARERAGLRTGGIYGGPMIKGFERFGQDLASQEYGNAYNRFNQDQSTLYNRLAGLAGTGQTTAQQVAGLGANMAANVGNTIQGIGNARASGYIGGANALSNAIGQGYNMWQGSRMLDLFRNQAPYSGGISYIEQPYNPYAGIEGEN
jgi:hypothetical protein